MITGIYPREVFLQRQCQPNGRPAFWPSRLKRRLGMTDNKACYSFETKGKRGLSPIIIIIINEAETSIVIPFGEGAVKAHQIFTKQLKQLGSE